MREFDEVGRIIEEFASEDATVVIGTVLDPDMEDEVRVTVVATGLNRAVARAAGARAARARRSDREPRAAGARGAQRHRPVMVDYARHSGAMPHRRRSRPNRAATCRAAGDYLDIPAFLRRQAD